MSRFFKNPKLKMDQKGVSLIELLLYFALLMIILLIATDLIIRSGEFSLEAGAQTAIQEDSRFITNRLSFDIHRANAINSPPNLGDSGSTLSITVGTETYTYKLTANNLEYEKIAGPSTLTANLNSNLTKVNSLSFQRLGMTGGKPTIKISFELQDLKKSKGGPLKKTFETVVGIR